MGQVYFRNSSERVNQADAENAAANLYNKSPTFRQKMDELAASGRIIVIDIKDKPSPPPEPQSSYSTISERNGQNVVVVDLYAEDFISRKVGADNNFDGQTDDANNDGYADAVIPYTFERALAHEMMHASDMSRDLNADGPKQMNWVKEEKIVYLEDTIMQEAYPETETDSRGSYARSNPGIFLEEPDLNEMMPQNTDPRYKDTAPPSPDAASPPWEWVPSNAPTASTNLTTRFGEIETASATVEAEEPQSEPSIAPPAPLI